MPSSTLDLPRSNASSGAQETLLRRPFPRLAAGLLAGGPLAVAATGGAVRALLEPDPTGTRDAGAASGPGPNALTVDGPGGVSVVTQVYEAGYQRPWHAHAGIHAVAILSGDLSVYDADWRRETHGRDRPYIGGQELHLVRNESGEPVEMVATYVSAGGPAGPARDWAAPPCSENAGV